MIPGRPPEKAAAESFLGGVEVAGKKDRLGGIGLPDVREDQPDRALAAPLRQIKVGVVDPEGAAGAAVAEPHPGCRSATAAPGSAFRVYNTHFYLTEGSRSGQGPADPRRIRKPILPSRSSLLATSTPPRALSRRLFGRAGLESTATLVNQQPPADLPVLRHPCAEHQSKILASPQWKVHTHRVINVKPGIATPADPLCTVIGALSLQVPARTVDPYRGHT